MKFIVAFVIGYLLGNINPAYIIGRIKGIDIREHGTFNAGASNAAYMFGAWAFFTVFFVDCAKTIGSFLIVRALYGDFALSVLAGVGSIIGHNFPFYLKFKGGKGFACYVALVFMINWKVCAIIGIIGVIIALVSKWVVGATLTFIILMPIYMAIWMPSEPIALAFICAASFVILHKHFTNFKKLANHKEIGMDGYYLGTKIKAEK